MLKYPIYIYQEMSRKADLLVRDWAVPRLLPLHLFAAWRWWRERAKRK